MWFLCSLLSWRCCVVVFCVCLFLMLWLVVALLCTGSVLRYILCLLNRSHTYTTFAGFIVNKIYSFAVNISVHCTAYGFNDQVLLRLHSKMGHSRSLCRSSASSCVSTRRKEKGCDGRGPNQKIDWKKHCGNTGASNQTHNKTSSSVAYVYTGREQTGQQRASTGAVRLGTKRE